MVYKHEDAGTTYPAGHSLCAEDMTRHVVFDCSSNYGSMLCWFRIEDNGDYTFVAFVDPQPFWTDYVQPDEYTNIIYKVKNPLPWEKPDPSLAKYRYEYNKNNIGIYTDDYRKCWIYETVTVKDAWTEKVLVREAGWY